MAPIYKKYLEADYDEIVELTEDELRSILRSATQAANYRIRQLERFGYGEYSEAYRAAMEGTALGKGKFTSSGKTTKIKLRKEVNRALSFLRSPTSELSGAEKRREWYLERFGIDNPDELKPFFKLYHQLVDADPHGGKVGALAKYLGNVGSDRIMRIVWGMRHYKVSDIEEVIAREYPYTVERLRNSE